MGIKPFGERFDKKNMIGYNIIGGGFGHGVGMSQYGAHYMALDGYDYLEILEHYYTGVIVE